VVAKKRTSRKRASDGNTITFQIDDRARKALDRLMQAAPPGIMRARSAIIRTALIEAADRLPKGSDE
jgi:predicted transcriptional regulator